MFVVGNALFGFDARVIAAFYGVDKLRFLNPTFIGDTIHAEGGEIINLQEGEQDFGVATAKLEVVNQRNEVALSCDFECTRPSQGAAHSIRQHDGIADMNFLSDEQEFWRDTVARFMEQEIGCDYVECNAARRTLTKPTTRSQRPDGCGS